MSSSPNDIPAAATPSCSDATLPPEAERLLHDLQLGTGEDPTQFELAAETWPAVPGYELHEEIGRGGMGVVYRARQLALNRMVALKMIGAAGRARAGEMARFLLEAEAVAAVRHPNVVEVYDSGSIEEPGGRRPYYAMEYVGGGTLAARLTDHGTLTPHEAARLVAAVARGTHTAHEAGIVHRDLKPANVLLAVGSGQWTVDSNTPIPASAQLTPHSPLSTLFPKVADFGLAKRMASDLTKTLAVMGTPAYMPPEQASGQAKFVGPTADIYALGVILFECLTGRTPFVGEDAWELVRQVVDDPAPSPRSLVRTLPRDLELICLKCLAKEPHDRYATAGDLADDLDAFAAGRSVKARPIPMVVRAVRWARARPTAAGLAALVAALLLVVPPLYVWNQGRLDRHSAAAREATRAEAAAKQAQDEAEKLAEARKRLADEADARKVEAEQLAAAREVFALENAIRRRLSTRPPEWTAANRTDLRRAAQLTVNPDARSVLRSAAASTLLAQSLELVEGIPFGGKSVAATAAPNSPEGPVVALGEYKNWLFCRIWLVDPTRGKVVRELSFPATPVPIGDGGLAQDGVRSLAFSSDGTKLFVGSRSARVFRFDLHDRRATRPTQTWTARTTAVEHLVLSRDGRFAFGICGDGDEVLRWDTATGECICWLQSKHGMRAIAIDPRTDDLIASDGPYLYRVSTVVKPNAPAGVPTASHPRRLAFSTNGLVLFAGRSEFLAAIDPTTLDETYTFADPGLGRAAHEERIAGLAMHPSGGFIASVSAATDDRRVKVWELASGRLVGAISVPGPDPIAIAWSPDGRYLLATASGELLRAEFVVPESARATLQACRPVRAAAFALGDGAIGGLVEGPDEVRAWYLCECRRGGPVSALPIRGGAGPGTLAGLTVARSPGRIAVSLARSGCLAFDPRSADPPATQSARPVRCPRFSPDGSSLWAVVDGDTATVWETKTGFRRGCFSNAGSKVVSGLPGLESLAVGRTRAAVGARDGSVHLLSDRAVRLATFYKSGDPVLALAFARDESLIAAGTRAGTIRLLLPDAASEWPGLAAHAGGVSALAFSADGELMASGGKDNAVRFWRRTAAGFELLFAVEDLPASVAALEFAPAGSELLVLLTHERAVRVWDAARLRSQLHSLTLGW